MDRTVQSYRSLAEKWPESFLLHLAGTLNNLGVMRNYLERIDGAVLAAEESVDVYRALAKQRPSAFMLDFPNALWTLGLVHLKAGNYRRAIEPLGEGLRLIMPAYEKLPQAFRRQTLGLAQALRQAAAEGNLPTPPDLAPILDLLTDA